MLPTAPCKFAVDDGVRVVAYEKTLMSNSKGGMRGQNPAGPHLHEGVKVAVHDSARVAVRTLERFRAQRKQNNNPLTCMKGSRSPSMTAPVLLVSSPERRSFTSL